MALPEVGVTAVIDNLANFSKGAATVTKAYDQMDAGATRVEKTSGGLGNVLSGLGGGLLTVGKVAAGAALGGVTILGAGVAALGTSAIGAASDVAEAESAFDATFGKAAPEARAELDEFAGAVGRNKFELHGFSGQIGALLRPMGLTETAAADMGGGFAELAVDLSSFFNTSESDALDALRSALIGESEPMRKFGVVINAAAIEQEALNLGLSDGTGELTAAQKAQATYSLIMKQTTQAQGDAIRTSGSWANQTRALSAAWDEFVVEIGQQLLPVLTPLLQQFTAMAKEVLPQVVDWVKNNLPAAIQAASDAWKEIQPVLAEIGKIIVDDVIPAIKAVVTWFKKDVPAGAGRLQAALKPVIDKVLPKLVDIFDVIYKWTVKNWPLIQKTIATVMDNIERKIRTVTKVISYIWDNWGDEIKKAVELVYKIIKTNLENALDTVTLIMQLITGDWAGAWETIKAIGKRSLDLISDLVKTSFNNMLKIITDIMTSIKNKISDIWSSIVSVVKDKVQEVYNAIKSKFDTFASLISGYASKLLSAAKDMMKGVIDGINQSLSAISSALTSTLTSAINTLKNAITSGSLASILLSAGQAIINKIKDGIAAITDLASRLIAKVQEAINNLSSAISSGTLYSILSQIGKNIMNKIVEGINAVTDLASKLIAKVQAAINSLSASSIFNSLYNVGRDIVNGIIDGVEAMGTSLRGALEDIVNDAIDAIKEQLGIGSPSKVFYGVGLDMMRGLQAGISAMAPTINTQLQAAVTGPSVAAPAAGTGGVYNYNTFELGGNTITSGMDAAVFEQKVLRVIRRNL